LKIRVAYDISFLATFFNKPAEQSGVFRAVEQLLFELCKRDDLELIATAACGRNPLFDVVKAARYLSDNKAKIACQFDQVLQGHFGLSQFYLRNFGGSAKDTGSESLRYSYYSERARWLLGYLVHRIDRGRVIFDHRRYDVFHSPFFKLPSPTVIGGVPRVLTIYDLICLKMPEFMPPALVALFLKICDSIDVERDWVACISEFTKQEFCEFTGMSPERVFVTPLAAADHFRPVGPDRIAAIRLKYGIPEAEYFLALGVLQPRKNFTHLIRCFGRLLSEHPELRVNLVIVGASGWRYNEILKAIGSSSEVRGRIIFTGHVPNEDLSAFYCGARGFLFPSLYEGFGLPPLEAMQCGTPVIASNSTAIPEVVGDGGVLVDPKDSDSMCQAMLNLLTDEELHRRLSEKGLARAREFSWAASAEKTINLYRTATTQV
jgi:glycosyltransferase involved in cell wall biosynthesis